MPHLYDGFVDRVTSAFEAALQAINAVHNFEYGPEFEIAICKTIRSVLPHRFGICRGYVVNSAGDTAGDDIVVYDRAQFPTARFLGEDLGRKEVVPIEAAAAYIEAKHTLELNGDGDSSLQRAATQAAAVKGLCEQRAAVSLEAISRHCALGAGLNVQAIPGWPSKRNPFYCAIFARHVRINPREAHASAEATLRELLERRLAVQLFPDLIIAGGSTVALPFVAATQTINSPFILQQGGGLACFAAQDVAFGVGLCHLLWALDSIELGTMPWAAILADATGIGRPNRT